MNKVDADGLGLLKKFLADQKSDAFFLEYLVFSLRLIQSHSQRGTRSAHGYGDADGRIRIFILKKFFNDFRGLVCNCQHVTFSFRWRPFDVKVFNNLFINGSLSITILLTLIKVLYLQVKSRMNGRF